MNGRVDRMDAYAAFCGENHESLKTVSQLSATSLCDLRSHRLFRRVFVGRPGKVGAYAVDMSCCVDGSDDMGIPQALLRPRK